MIYTVWEPRGGPCSLPVTYRFTARADDRRGLFTGSVLIIQRPLGSHCFLFGDISHSSLPEGDSPSQ